MLLIKYDHLGTVTSSLEDSEKGAEEAGRLCCTMPEHRGVKVCHTGRQAGTKMDAKFGAGACGGLFFSDRACLFADSRWVLCSAQQCSPRSPENVDSSARVVCQPACSAAGVIPGKGVGGPAGGAPTCHVGLTHTASRRPLGHAGESVGLRP